MSFVDYMSQKNFGKGEIFREKTAEKSPRIPRKIAGIF
jgi:hypothetical protein